ncbi:beta-1,3-galactosyltransferase 4 [Athene noctua]|uniref:beta-1,3-galactosyltransferase 4 n=1 Tax=Athene noctua TaxID=126797 RepID=UPI003EBD79EA
MWRRRRRRRWVGWGAGLALAVLGLGLAGGGGGEELLAAALAAWRERGGERGGSGEGFGGRASLWGGAATGGGFAIAANLSNGTQTSSTGANFGGTPHAANWGGPPILLSPPDCGPTPPFLLVLVPSSPDHAERRQAVRETWGAPQIRGGLLTRTLFVLGVPPPKRGGQGVQAALRAEFSHHGDLLQGAFLDVYANLTLKTLFLLRWATTRCPATPFLLKADDDVFVNLPALMTYLISFPPAIRHRLYLGRVHWWVRPDRDPQSRHHVPVALYPDAFFPLYCSGTAYVLATEAAASVLAASPHVPWVAPEDVWVGLCARRAGLSPRHAARMAGSARFPPDGCCYGEVLLSAHRVTPGELRRVWGLLRGGGCSGVQRVLGVLRCRVLAVGEWLWQ